MAESSATSESGESNSRLVAGAQAPLFEARTYNGAPIILEQLQGKKVWLIFYRYFNCPLCMHHMFDISEQYQKNVAKNCEVLAVYESIRFKIQSNSK
ncbi:MAG: redoxin domain-containing protein [Bdellovibrionota bacterium]